MSNLWREIQRDEVWVGSGGHADELLLAAAPPLLSSSARVEADEVTEGTEPRPGCGGGAGGVGRGAPQRRLRRRRLLGGETG